MYNVSSLIRESLSSGYATRQSIIQESIDQDSFYDTIGGRFASKLSKISKTVFDNESKPIGNISKAVGNDSHVAITKGMSNPTVFNYKPSEDNESTKRIKTHTVSDNEIKTMDNILFKYEPSKDNDAHATLIDKSASRTWLKTDDKPSTSHTSDKNMDKNTDKPVPWTTRAKYSVLGGGVGILGTHMYNQSTKKDNYISNV